MMSANDKPMTRALSRCSGGSLSAKMAMKTRLSMPSTTSNTTKVMKPAQILGSSRNSIIEPSKRPEQAQGQSNRKQMKQQTEKTVSK